MYLYSMPTWNITNVYLSKFSYLNLCWPYSLHTTHFSYNINYYSHTLKKHI